MCQTVCQVLRAAQDLQQLQQVIQQLPHSPFLTTSQAVVAFQQAAALAKQQSSASPEAAADAKQLGQQVLQLLAPLWHSTVASATIKQLSDCLMSLTRLGCQNEELWRDTLAAVTSEQCKEAGGQELSNIAYSIAATADANSGSVPGTSREVVESALRAVTQQLVSMVQGPGGISHHSHSHSSHSQDHDGGCDHDSGSHGDECGHSHGDKGGVTVYHISMVRYAHEVLGL
eukprot:gene8046-8241_t